MSEYKCLICRDKEYIEILGEDGVAYMRECICRAKKQSMRRIQRSGLENVIETCTFKAYIATEPWQRYAKGQAVKFAVNPEGWFYLGGQVGSGKTHLCTAIVHALINKGMEARYMLWRDESITLKSLITRDEEYKERIEPFKQVKVLYIDDFLRTPKIQGRPQQPSSADINIMLEIINYRYLHKDLITVISSERTLDEIIEFDEALGSRIMQKAQDYCVAIDSIKDRNYRTRGMEA